MTRYLLDTAHALELCSKNLILRQRIALDADSEFGLCSPSLGDLWFDAFRSSRTKQNARMIRRISRGFVFWDFETRAAVEYGLIRSELTRKSHDLPVVDMQIAAIARRNGLILLAAEPHFSFVENLRIQNWLA